MTIANRYVDLTTENFAGYLMTNENLDLLGKLASEAAPGKTLAIASGGDFVLLGLVPRGSDVYGVDASYRSIATTMVKSFLLERYPPEDLRRFLSQGPNFFADFR